MKVELFVASAELVAPSPTYTTFSDFDRRNGKGVLAVLRGMLAFRLMVGDRIRRGDGEQDGELL